MIKPMVKPTPIPISEEMKMNPASPNAQLC
jgi:hypothetical protein